MCCNRIVQREKISKFMKCHEKTKRSRYRHSITRLSHYNNSPSVKFIPSQQKFGKFKVVDGDSYFFEFSQIKRLFLC